MRPRTTIVMKIERSENREIKKPWPANLLVNGVESAQYENHGGGPQKRSYRSDRHGKHDGSAEIFISPSIATTACAATSGGGMPVSARSVVAIVITLRSHVRLVESVRPLFTVQRRTVFPTWPQTLCQPGVEGIPNNFLNLPGSLLYHFPVPCTLRTNFKDWLHHAVVLGFG
jgi:hypothetical protein